MHLFRHSKAKMVPARRCQKELLVVHVGWLPQRIRASLANVPTNDRLPRLQGERTDSPVQFDVNRIPLSLVCTSQYWDVPTKIVSLEQADPARDSPGHRSKANLTSGIILCSRHISIKGWVCRRGLLTEANDDNDPNSCRKARHSVMVACVDFGCLKLDALAISVAGFVWLCLNGFQYQCLRLKWKTWPKISCTLTISCLLDS